MTFEAPANVAAAQTNPPAAPANGTAPAPTASPKEPPTTPTPTTTGRTPTSFNPRAQPLSSLPQQQDTAVHVPASANNTNNEDWVRSTSHAFEESIARPASEALHSFFYPPVREREATSPPRAAAAAAAPQQGDNNNNKRTKNRRRRKRRAPPGRSSSQQSSNSQNSNPHRAVPPRGEFDEHFHQQQVADKAFVERFWTAFDDIIILSLFTQVGIVARLGVSTWFTFFDGGVFSNDSPLFVNLPLNCLSCFLMGLLASGASLMEIIATR